MKALVKIVDCEKISDINYVLEDECIAEEWITLERIRQYPRIRDYISQIEYDALINKKIDYIVFKLEE